MASSTSSGASRTTMWSSRITPTAMLPPSIQPMPPNILRSTTPGRACSRSEMRAASCSSYAISASSGDPRSTARQPARAWPRSERTAASWNAWAAHDCGLYDACTSVRERRRVVLTIQEGGVMRTARRFWLLVAAVTAGTLSAAAGSASAADHVCVPVFATGVGQDNGDFTTNATISSLGFMVGTSAAAFEPTASPPDRQNFTGAIVFTTAAGTLTAPVDGTFFPSGEFTATSNSVSGTGLLRGVTGKLDIHGTEDL